MVEPQIVVLVVAGSSPVGHPPLQIQISGLKPVDVEITAVSPQLIVAGKTLQNRNFFIDVYRTSTRQSPVFAPEFLLKGGISFQKQDCFDIALTAVYVSQQFWQDTNIGSPTIPKAKIPPYKTFNLSGDWYLTKRLRLIAGISNLTDEKYYDRVFANGIEPAPRRSGYAGLSLAF